MVIWDKFGKANWDFHEHYFRGGWRSGQRDLLDWYMDTVHKDYYCIYEYKELSVWVQKEAFKQS